MERRVESEFHFLLRCNAYADLRQQWMDSIALPDGFDDCNDVDKTKVLINLSNVKATAQYIVEAFKQRTKVLFSRANHNN